LPTDGDHGNVDIGKNVGRRPQDHHRAQNQNE
jgi:hypothetical protein